MLFLSYNSIINLIFVKCYLPVATVDTKNLKILISINSQFAK
jgi:hypothetical protein